MITLTMYVQDCALALDSIYNIVAKGTVYPKTEPNETIHTVPLGKEDVRVRISFAITGDALLPKPVQDEYLTVDSAVGVFVAWPKKWVILNTGIVVKNYNKWFRQYKYVIFDLLSYIFLC